MQIKNLLIGAAITILTFLVIFTGIQTFYENPKYEDFCGNIIYPGYEINTSVECEDLEGKWNPYYPDGYTRPAPVKGTPDGYCDIAYYCNLEYNTKQENYTKTLFIVALIIGIILLLIGAKLFDLEAVGAGIMGGGIITLVYGSGSYWQYAGDVFRFVISIVGLILVISLAYWINKQGNFFKSKKKK